MIEEIAIYTLASVAGVFALLPVLKLGLRKLRSRSPLKEARERHRIAEEEAKAAELNKQTEKIYETLYSDITDDKEHKKS